MLLNLVWVFFSCSRWRKGWDKHGISSRHVPEAEPSPAGMWQHFGQCCTQGMGNPRAGSFFLSLAPVSSQQGKFSSRFLSVLDLLEVLVLGTAPRADTEPNLSLVPLQHYLPGTAVMGTELEWNSFLNPGSYQELSEMGLWGLPGRGCPQKRQLRNLLTCS